MEKLLEAESLGCTVKAIMRRSGSREEMARKTVKSINKMTWGKRDVEV